MVSLLGLGGIGKSALAVSLMHRVAEHFEVVIWRSMRDLPTCEALLDDLLQVLAPPGVDEATSSFDQRLSIVLGQMRKTRTLMVLDNIEVVLEESGGSGRMRPGYEGFGRFLRRVAETEHRGCVLLTSREKPGDLISQEGSHSPVRVLRLARLDAEACEALLIEKGVKGTTPERVRLIEAYTGNPMALKIVSQTIVDLFDGDLSLFLEQGELIYGGIRELLREQFSRLSDLEQCVLVWLAILREPSTFEQLRAMLVTPLPPGEVLEAVEGLRRRNLIDRGQYPGSFTLQSVVLEYVTTVLLADASEEIQQGNLDRLIKHGLEQAHAKDYVRQAQEKVLVAPLLTRLQSASHALAHSDLEARLVALLDQMRSWSEDAQGYAPANLIALLRLQRSDLRDLDLSRLALRGVNLQGIEMQDTSLSKARIQDSTFTETFDAMTAVAINSSGTYWAAASRRGEIRVWAATGASWALNLRRSWRAHTDMVWALAFSPDGGALATGSWDGTVKLWNVDSGALLWSGRHASHVNCVAFTRDGTMLASSGIDAAVRIWDRQSGKELQTLPHPAPVTTLVWRPHGHFLATGNSVGAIRLWDVREDGPAICGQTIQAHTDWVDSLAFSPEGNILASGSWDSTVKLWEVAFSGATREISATLMQTLMGHTDRVGRVAWSPDGHTLASGSRDRTIRLWDAERASYRTALQGHTASVHALAFTPDSRAILTAGEDGTLRVWDIVSGQCIRLIQGYAAFLYDTDWSPDGAQLASGGTDSLVTIYDVNGAIPPRVLRAHTGGVIGVAWRPRTLGSGSQTAQHIRLATSEWDNAIRLWDPSSETSLQILQHPEDTGNCFYGLAWSPDGRWLAAGTYDRGVQLFDITAGNLAWNAPDFPTLIRPVAWSPDGTVLAGGGDNGTAYIWDSTASTLLQTLPGHHGMIRGIAWNSEGTQLASAGSGSEGAELFIWDVRRGELAATVRAHPGVVYAVAWGPAGNLLITGGGDGAVRWWDIATGECVRTRQAHQGTVQALKKSPDGSKLASCGDDGAVMLWDLNTGDHLQTLRRDRPYERLNITGIIGLTEAQKATLRTLGAIDDSALRSTYSTP